MSRAPGWRDRAATDLVRKHLPYLDVEGPVLVMEDPNADEVAGAFGELLGAPGAGAVAVDPVAADPFDALDLPGPPAGGSVPVGAWHRRARDGRPASPWPPASPFRDGPFRTALLRLPRARDELEMASHAAAQRLAPGGRLLVYGAKDEGAGSAAGRLEPLFEAPRSVATGGRCRLVEATRPQAVPGLRAGLEAWRIVTGPPHPDVGAERWVSYPGVFAAGRLDEGTALLLGCLDGVVGRGGENARVLDFGCGDGVVAGVLCGRTPGLAPVMLDVDTVALAAAAENVPAGVPVAGDGLGSVGEIPPFDAVVSNPPYHRGKDETVGIVRGLIRDARRRLAAEGSLTLVVQRRLPVETAMAAAFESVEVVADGGAFRVWRGTGPSGDG
ncbi:MAG: methyltransferase [Gemmatimonadota bacterium]|jgi:16S rRNA (guanine1207-N2)-methyltransferase